DLAMQVVVSQRPAIARLTFPDDRGLVSTRTAHVSINTVDAGVQLAADEPLRVWRLPVEHAIPALRPLELSGKPCPVRFAVARGLRVQIVVFDVSLRAELLRRREAPVFAEQIVELRRLGIRHVRRD